MFVPVISPVRELSSSSLSDVFLGKYSHTVQGSLEFAQMLLMSARQNGLGIIAPSQVLRTHARSRAM